MSEESGELDDLSNTRFVEKPELTKEEIREQKRMQKNLEKAERDAKKEELKEQRLREKEMRKLEKSSRPKMPSFKEESDDDVFSEQGTEIVGQEKRTLLAKITSYKQLFKDELKGFRVKKGASVEELKATIDEFESILNTSGVDQFLTDGVLSSLRVIEGVSANTQSYNITGMTDMLKSNPHFHSLSKRLFLKYGAFSGTPVELQAVFLIATTAFICRQKNMKRNEMNSFLDSPV